MEKKKFLRDVIGIGKDAFTNAESGRITDFKKFSLLAYMSYKFAEEIGAEYPDIIEKGTEEDWKFFDEKLYEKMRDYGKELNFYYDNTMKKELEEMVSIAIEQNDNIRFNMLPVGAVEWINMQNEIPVEKQILETDIEHAASLCQHPLLKNNYYAREKVKQWFKLYDKYVEYLASDGKYDFNAKDAEFIPICMGCGHLRFFLYSKCPNCGEQYFNNDSSEAKYCTNCGAEITENMKYCSKCGTEVTADKRYCANCGTEVTGDINFCTNCGCKI